MNHLTWDKDRFYLDGEPFSIYSAAMHYFRIPAAYWADRLTKLRDCGFNTVETYTCWNLHERQEGQFDFTGMLDIAGYLRTAASLGLKVILRPGPYICAEWEAGGLPAWLHVEPGLPLRCYDESFLAKVRRYYTALTRQIRPFLATNGGPVLLMQVENEYGSYGDDSRYMQSVADIYRQLGIDIPLFTADGPTDWMFRGGTLPGVLAAANFGSDPKGALARLKQVRPEQPMLCGEFWSGWFDHWYEAHHTRTADSTLQDVRDMVEMGASFNMYMFHGGTNFGFWNGANHAGIYQPTVTSYDYCAPLSEEGNPTSTYFALQQLLYPLTNPGKPLPRVEKAKAVGYGKIALTRQLGLFDAARQLGKPVFSPVPLAMERIGQDVGYILYTTTLTGPFEELELVIEGLHDRAHIFGDGVLLGIQERDRRWDTVTLALAKGESLRLDILVENMGRINYGPEMFDEKGITGNLRLGQQCHFGWQMTGMTMDNLTCLQGYLPVENAENCCKNTDKADTFTPIFLKGSLTVTGEPADTFLQLPGFGKGFVAVNDFVLGRYFNTAGPQQTLYLPAPLLHTGENEITVFETDCMQKPELLSRDTSVLG